MADLIQIGVDVRTNIKQATADLDKMGGSVVNNINTINRLESEVAQLNKELGRGRVTEAAYAKGMQQINNELGLFQQRAAKAADVERKFGQAAAGGGKSLNRFNMTLQQGGYQLQDFVVQLQSGTSFFTAFSQQGSQFASIFGPQGAVIGAVIAIGSAIGGMALAMLGASKDTRTLEEALGDLSDSVDEYRDAIERANASSSEITEEFGLLSSQLRSVLKDFEELARIKVMDQLGVSIGKLRSEHISGFESDLENIKDLLGMSGIFAAGSETVAQFNGTLKGLEDSTLSLGERLQDAFTLRDLFLENVGSIEQMTEAQQAFYSDLLTTIEQLEKFQGTALTNYDDILGSAEGLAAQEEALNEIFESRLGTIDDTANNYVDILGTAEGLAAQEQALNQLYESRLGTIDDTYNNYEDILGSAEGLAAQEKALNDLFEDRLGTIDDTFNNYEDILGSEEGLQKSVDVLNQMYQDRLDKLQATADAYDDILGSEAGLLAAEEARLALTQVGDSGYAGGRGGDPREFSDYFDFVKQITDQEEERNKVTRESTKAVKDNRTAYEKAMMTAKEFADALDQQVLGAVDGVADAFSNFLQRGMKDFKSFVGSIKDMFIKLLADMAAMALKRRILIPIATGFMSGMGSAAAAQTMGSFTGSAATMAGTAAAFGGGVSATIGGVTSGYAASGITGAVSGGLSAAGAGVSAGLTAGGTAGFAAAAGAALPVIGAVIIGAKILGGLFGGGKPAISAENMNKVNQALVMTGQELGATGREAEQAAAALGEVAGGFDKLTKKSQAFYENFYTEGERRADAASAATQALNKTFAELEMAVPKTHAEFRQLVEAQDLMTDAGRKTYNALLDVSGAFVTLKGTAEQANEAIKLERARELEQRAKKALPLTERFVAQEMINQQIETLGTTAELNEFLLRGLDSYLSIANVPAYARKEQLERVKEQLDGFLEDTTYVQNIQREFYEGLKKPIQEVKNMLKQVGGSKQDMAQYERYGDISGDLMDKLTERFGKYFEYNVLPYTTQLELFIKDQVSRVIGPLVEAIRVTNFRGDLGVINKKIEVSAGRVTSGYAALASGYRKIVEAVDKVEDYYERDFANLRTEYTGAAGLESSTAVKSITDRISGILDLPKRLVGVIENSMRTLARQADKLSGSFVKVQQEYIKLKYSGQEVSEGLEESYRDMLAERQAAGKAAAEAQKRVEQLTLFIRTVEGAVQGFKDSVERVVTSPIEEALAVFLPTELDSLAQDVRTQIKEILGSMGEGTLDTFETGLVTLSDLLASNTITVDQFNNSFKLMQDVFEGNISLTDQYTTKQQSVVEKLSSAYEDFTSKLQNLLGVVRSGIESLIGQATDVNAVANRRGSLAYLRAVASTGQVDASRLESAVGVVTSGDISGFGTRQEFLRYVADTTSLLRTVEGTLSGQLDTLEMQQVKAILNIQDTNETAATSLQNIQALLAEFLGVGGRIPTFATGGYHAGGLRIVGENGPELEATGPSRIIPAGKFSMGGDAELRREVAELRVDLKAALVQIAKNTRKSSDTLNKFDYQGLPNSRGY